ncbi:MAG: hypothetical protein KA004_15825 [Verrucomicrobiales bacterium]|nr:hypothetical protein [Verrucomicrobiales bacterium]
MKPSLAHCVGLLLSALPAAAGTILELTWNVAPGGASYLGTGSTERGIAYNKTNNHLLLASRGGGNHLMVLDATNGEPIGEMATTGIAGGNGNAFNMIGVADDGAVYACNLIVAGAAAGTFKIYRWDSDNVVEPVSAPSIAYQGDPSVTGDPPSPFVSLRWGDSMAVRGSGIDTQIICGSGGTAVAIFTTTDGLNFTSHFINGAQESGGGKGISFGAGDIFYTKANGAGKKLRRSSFNLTDSTSAVLNDFSITTGAGTQFIPIALNLAKNWWGTFETGGAGPETVKLYDISSAGSAPTILNALGLPHDNANSNAVGSTALSDTMLFVCDTNNGLQGYGIVVTPDVVPPTLGASPLARSVLERGQTTFSIIVNGGTLPLQYKWFKDDVEILNQSGPEFTVNPVLSTSGGAYKCTVSNSAGSATSTPAVLTVLPSVDSAALTECWHIAPGSRPYLQNDETQRGMDFDPVKNRLYLASRTPAPSVQVLDAATGAGISTLNLGEMANVAVYPGATYPINMVAVAEDGAIFATNLSNTTDGTNFRLFRWGDDDPGTVPSLVYEGNLFDTDDVGPITGTRCGDTLDVRGAGVNTQIVVSARNRSEFAVFRTIDGSNFTPTVSVVAGMPATGFGLGVAFGEGDTLWGKMIGQPLSYVSFDAVGNATLLHSIPTTGFASSAGPIGVDLASGSLAALAVENSDNLRLYDLPVPFPNPGPASLTLADQEFLTTDNVNANGTGSVAVKNGKAYVLDSFNGLACYLVNKSAPPEISSPAYNAQSGQFTFTLKGVSGKTYRIQKSSDMSAWTDDGTETLDNGSTKSVIRNGSGPSHFFRAKEQ